MLSYQLNIIISPHFLGVIILNSGFLCDGFITLQSGVLLMAAMKSLIYGFELPSLFAFILGKTVNVVIMCFLVYMISLVSVI